MFEEKDKFSPDFLKDFKKIYKCILNILVQ